MDAFPRAIQLGEDSKIDQKDTEITKTNAEEDTDFFLIKHSDSGLVVLGTKYLVSQLFESKFVMGDGTFKAAPKGYLQIYILWIVISGNIEGELTKRSKAYPAVYFIMKSKHSTEYKEAFDILENYR